METKALLTCSFHSHSSGHCPNPVVLLSSGKPLKVFSPTLKKELEAKAPIYNKLTLSNDRKTPSTEFHHSETPRQPLDSAWPNPDSDTTTASEPPHTDESCFLSGTAATLRGGQGMGERCSQFQSKMPSTRCTDHTMLSLPLCAL